MRLRAGFAGGQRGVVSLEFVLMLPFLLMVLLGIIDVSFILCDKAVITNASREAARAGVVLHVPQLSTAQISTVALAYTQNNLITGGTATAPTVAVSQPSGTSSGNPLSVTISYTYTGLVLGSAFSALTGPVTITATTVMNYE
ncbi:pilus assembly protein TadE [Burkholderia sp. ABCPW 14]|uniref:Pilus assembly protein TadE n=1 Tax=Burkholderia mayonis TaxID=1385591 RepID=A0A1B4G6B1_9BURK|nr:MULTISPECIES: TadE/TadG family type IV pilus assembly protein [Burkholderia]AOJ11448.1 pilus assembly protein TadE [Burkholderia mayonis]KVD79243.1 pilus assembly protein TadE [Burkholderia sp. ABCPW 14]KVE46423.1 pilus assembly protein TadE [Burkholderia mayonis]